MNGKQWVDAIRNVIESGYYLAGIALAYIAYRGLAQIRLAKEIAATTARRESFKLALEQCHFYAREIVPTRAKLVEVARTKGLGWGTPGSFSVSGGEIVAIDNGNRNILAECVALDQHVVQYINRLEAFAMAFTSGLADEMVGYRETAPGFCQAAAEALPFIDHCRKNKIARYESTVELLEIWSKRILSQELAKKKQAIDQDLAGLKDARIKAIGTE
jgi:hypothetical protein